jgi:hypothetical protein
MGLQSKPTGPVSTWAFDEKLKYVFEHVAQKAPGELGNALKELVSPSSLATTAAIFGIWAGAQFTPYGWVADIAFAGIGYLFVGAEIWEVITGLYNTAKLISNAKCEGGLKEAGNALARGLGSAVAASGLGAAAKGASKISKLIKFIFRDRYEAQRAATLAKLNLSYYGAFVKGRMRYGDVANAEHIARRSGAYPPWSVKHEVTDRWIERDAKIYMVNGAGAEPGGWATPKRYTSLAEARRELAILNEFTEKRGRWYCRNTPSSYQFLCATV